MPEPDHLDALRIDRSEPEAVGSGPRLSLVFLAIFFILVAIGGGWWYLTSQIPKVSLAVAELLPGDSTPGATTVLDASGYVTARRRATVSSKTTGKIVDVLIEEGMAVAENQVLARLDDAITSRQLSLAEAQLTLARSTLEENRVRLAEANLSLDRTRNLVAEDVRSQAELDAAQAAVGALEARLAQGQEEITVAERQLDLRRQELDDLVIRAPFAGVVITKDAQPGEMISPVSAGGGFTRTGICTVVDMSSLEVEVDVNEAYINRVKPEQKITAVLDAYPEWKIPGRVITSVPTADRQRATVQVRIAFEELDTRILPDMGVKVSFLDDPGATPAATQTASRGVLVPSTAIRHEGEQGVVFVLAGERVERRAVGLGKAEGDRIAVTSGLSAGERVVIDGPEALADGDRVAVR